MNNTELQWIWNGQQTKLNTMDISQLEHCLLYIKNNRNKKEINGNPIELYTNIINDLIKTKSIENQRIIIGNIQSIRHNKAIIKANNILKIFKQTKRFVK
jgi:hypothetical protein